MRTRPRNTRGCTRYRPASARRGPIASVRTSLARSPIARHHLTAPAERANRRTTVRPELLLGTAENRRGTAHTAAHRGSGGERRPAQQHDARRSNGTTQGHRSVETRSDMLVGSRWTPAPTPASQVRKWQTWLRSDCSARHATPVPRRVKSKCAIFRSGTQTSGLRRSGFPRRPAQSLSRCRNFAHHLPGIPPQSRAARGRRGARAERTACRGSAGWSPSTQSC